jgi:hypothetical protein
MPETEWQQAHLIWLAEMVGAGKAMSLARRDELEAWEREHIDGVIGTWDWPGWVEILGRPRPLPPAPHPKLHKDRVPQVLRTAVMERDLYRCRQCGTHLDLTVDHVHPESLGGETVLENLQTLCRSCNSKKGAEVE